MFGSLSNFDSRVTLARCPLIKVGGLVMVHGAHGRDQGTSINSRSQCLPEAG